MVILKNRCTGDRGCSWVCNECELLSVQSHSLLSVIPAVFCVLRNPTLARVRARLLVVLVAGRQRLEHVQNTRVRGFDTRHSEETLWHSVEALGTPQMATPASVRVHLISVVGHVGRVETTMPKPPAKRHKLNLLHRTVEGHWIRVGRLLVSGGRMSGCEGRTALPPAKGTT